MKFFKALTVLSLESGIEYKEPVTGTDDNTTVHIPCDSHPVVLREFKDNDENGRGISVTEYIIEQDKVKHIVVHTITRNHENEIDFREQTVEYYELNKNKII